MSGAVREKDSSDYDLERLTELFDQALTSDDPRVKNALRQLMMMVVLTSNDHEDQDKRRLTSRQGPMRRMQEDVRDLHRTVEALRQEIQNLQKQEAWNRGYSGSPASGMRAQSGPDAISAQDYWAQVVTAQSFSGQISEGALRDLNTSIAPALKGLKDA